MVSAAPPQAGVTSDPLLQALLLQMLQQQQQQQFSVLSALPGALGPPPIASASASVPSSATLANTVITLPREISVEDFCERYKISEADCNKLKILEVALGDRRCESLEKDVWSGEGGFSSLGWDRFKEKHARFCEDVRDGLWA